MLVTKQESFEFIVATDIANVEHAVVIAMDILNLKERMDAGMQAVAQHYQVTKSLAEEDDLSDVTYLNKRMMR